MSVISAVAEHADLASQLTSPSVAKSAAVIAGKFKVIRTELATIETLSSSQLIDLQNRLADIQEWVETGDNSIITARILPDPMAGLREAQAIAARNARAAAKLAQTFEDERAWQRDNGSLDRFAHCRLRQECGRRFENRIEWPV